MLRKIICLLILLLPFMCIAQIISKLNTAVQPTITILRTEPEQPVEGMSVIVYFRFTNNSVTPGPLSGWIGADINSGSAAPGVSPVDWPVTELPDKQSVNGAVAVTLPDAGANKMLRVFFYSTQQQNGDRITKSPPLYTTQASINIAALMNFKLENFTIRHTRARSTDTDWGSLYVSVDNQAAMNPISFFLGNFEDGTFPFLMKDEYGRFTKPVESGLFRLIPDNNSTIRMSYFMYNGGSIEDSKGFLKGFAEATANPELFKGKRPGSSTLYTLARILNPFFNIMGACDGFVAGEVLDISSNDLFYNSINGSTMFNRRFNTEEFASQAGCGNTSDYEILSYMKRISSASTPAYITPVFSSITANRKINIRASMGETITWKRLETIGPNGEFITVNDAEYGYFDGSTYTAPREITRPLLVLVRGVMTQLILARGSFQVIEGGPLGTSTAIIQLVPGARKMNPAKYNQYNARPPRQ